MPSRLVSSVTLNTPTSRTFRGTKFVTRKTWRPSREKSERRNLSSPALSVTSGSCPRTSDHSTRTRTTNHQATWPGSTLRPNRARWESREISTPGRGRWFIPAQNVTRDLCLSQSWSITSGWNTRPGSVSLITRKGNVVKSREVNLQHRGSTIATCVMSQYIKV